MIICSGKLGVEINLIHTKSCVIYQMQCANIIYMSILFPNTSCPFSGNTMAGLDIWEVNHHHGGLFCDLYHQLFCSKLSQETLSRQEKASHQIRRKAQLIIHCWKSSKYTSAVFFSKNHTPVDLIVLSKLWLVIWKWHFGSWYPLLRHNRILTDIAEASKLVQIFMCFRHSICRQACNLQGWYFLLFGTVTLPKVFCVDIYVSK